jgi:predicted polyphosphate/ATP-dependent NAD kinase
MIRVGFLINPIAGMGGTVGLKGTDRVLEEALRRGAVPGADGRAKTALSLLNDAPVHFFTCSGAMGEDALKETGITSFTVVYTCPGITSDLDTRGACRAFLEKNIDLILFCGGDGTARIVYEEVGNRIPILGIPAGVKMYSAVFAVTPAAAGGLVTAIALQGWSGRPGPEYTGVLLRDTEVVDVDEDAYRKGELRTRLFGFARSPSLPGFVQATKQVYEETEEERAKDDIARFMSEIIAATPETIYILGPGTTTAAVMQRFGIEKTILGFDALVNGRSAGHDLNEKDMLGLLDGGRKARLIISIIGAQGSVLGRGTQQVSPEVLKRIGVENVIVVATPHKVRETPLIFIDTGDTALDRSFGDHIRVITGYHVAQRKVLGRPTGPEQPGP